MKGIVERIKTAFNDFKRGLSIILGKPEEGKGDRKLAKMSLIVMGQIPVYGKNAVRSQVIKSVTSDLKRANKKGGADEIERKIRTAVRTPEYMRLLRKLDLGESHLRVMALDATRKSRGVDYETKSKATKG